jgi:hypothetical protein
MAVIASDQRVAAAELEHIDQLLRPPCQASPYTVTGHLARSATALLYSARGPAFGPRAEGVLKITGTIYAPILRRELGLLLMCAAADIPAIIRPLRSDLEWLSIGGPGADRPAAALPLPFLSGGDLTALAARAARAGELGPDLALRAARPIATALRGLLERLEPPIAHGDVRPQNVLLPSPHAPIERLVLIDLDAAREPADARARAEDVRGFGQILSLLATGDLDAEPGSSPHRAFETLVRGCLGRGGDQYTSFTDPRLWHDLESAEAVPHGSRARSPVNHVLDAIGARLPRWPAR